MSGHIQIPAGLADAVSSLGMIPPDPVKVGDWTPCAGAGKSKRNQAGRVKLFEDLEGAIIWDWSTGLTETWQARKPANEVERKQWQERIENARHEAEQERTRKRDKAAKTAADRWAKAGPADALHGYLVSKGVQAHGLRQDGNKLLIPLRNEAGEIKSIQTIDGAGEKLFHPGGQIKGNHYLIGEPGPVLVVAEGYATAASIHEVTGHPVACAMNCGNLKPVAEAMRRKYPEARLMVAADDDQHTEGNPGLTKAREAAQAVSGEVVTPGQAGDFNDLHAAQGADALRARFEQPERAGSDLPMVEIGDLADANLPEPEHITERVLPVAVPTLLGGHGGAGKSMVGLTMGACAAMGRPFMGMATQQVAVLVYSAEDGAAVVRYRLAKICEAENIKPADLAKHLHVIDATDIDPTLFIEKQIRDDIGTSRRGITTEAFSALAEKAKEIGARLVIIDNASDTFEANENERNRVRAFIRSLAWLARHIDGAVLLLSHVDKATAKAGGSSEGYSGSTAWHNSVRSRMYLHGDGLNLTIEHQKANLGELAEPILMHWHHGTLAAGHTGNSTDPARELMDTHHQHAILTMILERTERGQFISTSSTAGNAWLALNGLDGFPKIDKRTFWRLMDKAQGAGGLQREVYQDCKRMNKERFSVTPAGKDWLQMIAMEMSR